jgi:hypothetical protein
MVVTSVSMRAIEAHHALNCGVRAVLLVRSLAAHNSSTAVVVPDGNSNFSQ